MRTRKERTERDNKDRGNGGEQGGREQRGTETRPGQAQVPAHCAVQYIFNCVGGRDEEEECLLQQTYRPGHKYLPSKELRSAYIVSCVGFMSGQWLG